ncbi:MAG: hypothetical protein JSS67_00615 [Bacteroidetes bacterium]|nr:hypothetical protein [Bacteroidota bacterium]
MFKKIMLVTICSGLAHIVYSQRTPAPYTSTETSKGFQKENIFLGGGLNLGFGTGSFGVGLNPEVGYSIANWMDAGIAINASYQSINADYNYGYSQKSFNYGAGIFTRIYPIQFLFLQIQPEHNWSNNTLKDPSTNFSQKINFQSNSLLAGIGYANRIVGQGNFYTVIMIDLMSDLHSPYRDGYNHILPVIRAGFNFYLKPSVKK